MCTIACTGQSEARGRNRWFRIAEAVLTIHTDEAAAETRLCLHVYSRHRGQIAPVVLVLTAADATGLACSMRGVRSVLRELEAHFLAALAATVARHRHRWQALGYSVPLVLQHDARHPPLRQVEVIISSPPSPGMVHTRNYMDPQKLRMTHIGRSSQAHAGGYAPTQPGSVAYVRWTRCKPAFS
jgi:hypothetical protein